MNMDIKYVWIEREDGASLCRIYTADVVIDGTEYVLVKYKAGPYVDGEHVKRQTVAQHEQYLVDGATDPTLNACQEASFS